MEGVLFLVAVCGHIFFPITRGVVINNSYSWFGPISILQKMGPVFEVGS